MPEPEPVPEYRVYTKYEAKKTWSEALAYCKQNHDGLAVITDANENEAVYRTTYPHKNGYWIGMNDHFSEGVWGWEDGTATGYTNWQPGEPNNVNNQDCAAFGDFRTYPRAKWLDAGCQELRPFVCYDWSFTEVMPPKDKFFIPHTHDGKVITKNFNNAKHECNARGGKLASIRN